MKLATNMMIAPITGVGMMESTALNFGENPSRMNNPPAANPIQRLVAPVALLNATLLAEVSDATPPNTPDAVTAMASAIKPCPTRRMSGRDHSASLTFSQRMRLPNDFNAPQMDTIAKVGRSDQRKENCHIPSNRGIAIQGTALQSWNWTELIKPARKQTRYPKAIPINTPYSFCLPLPQMLMPTMTSNVRAATKRFIPRIGSPE